MNKALTTTQKDAAARTARPTAAVESRVERTRILLFVKILLRCLEKRKMNNTSQIIKAIVSTCVKRNKSRDNQFVPLGKVLETMLKQVVDECIWDEAKSYQQHYYNKKKMASTKKTAETVALTAFG